jgi:PhnB protein
MSKKKAAKKTAARKAAPKAKAAASKKPAPIPAGYHTVTPYLVCRGAANAIEFYKKAFGAKQKLVMSSPDGKVMHAEIRIGDSHVMLGDEMPQMGATAPQTIGGTAGGLLLYVKDVDKAFAQAIAAGATTEMPPTNMFWGDRYCKLADPFGHKWSLATHIEDVSPKEMARRGAEAMTKPPSGV